MKVPHGLPQLLKAVKLVRKPWTSPRLASSLRQVVGQTRWATHHKPLEPLVTSLHQSRDVHQASSLLVTGASSPQQVTTASKQ